LWLAWNPEDVEGFRSAFGEILKADDHSAHALHLAESGFVSLISSEYRGARRSLVESRAIILEAMEENLYLNGVYSRAKFHLAWSLLFLGEWGEALHEIKDMIAMLEKNGDYSGVRTASLLRAWIHFHAMDFAGVLTICDAAFPLIRDPELRPAPEYQAPYQWGFWMRLFLSGSAETAFENYDSALEYLEIAQADMDRISVMLGWFWRMPIESALSELWLAKGDLVRARQQADSFLKITLATGEHTWQALAWEVNARVAMSERDLMRGQECIAGALSVIEGFELPLAAWRIHATAAELYRRAKAVGLAKRHLAQSRKTILELADSLPVEEPLRQTFLTSPLIRAILGEGERPGLHAEEPDEAIALPCSGENLSLV
jgi:tetratricopeptide (TPR) repeat protein